MRSCSPLQMLALVAGAMLLGLGAAAADSGKPAAIADPTFGSRTDKPDGSAAVTIGRRLPVEWDAKVGTDMSLAATPSNVPSENLLRGTAPERSSGALWGSITMPGLPAFGFDTTAVEARLDGGNDEGKLGATLSRSLPIGSSASLSLQNTYAVTQSLASPAPAMTPLPMDAMAPAGSAARTPNWSAAETVRLSIAPSGTTFSAGAESSTLDSQWHHKLSVEQTLFGPLKVTTSVEDPGRTDSKKSITAGFKRVW